jgi:hypothetical protein
MMPATTAAPIVPPDTPLSEAVVEVAGCALPLLVDALCVPLLVDAPELALELAVVVADADRTASCRGSEKSNTLEFVQLVP